jgi:cell division protein FtsZ
VVRGRGDYRDLDRPTINRRPSVAPQEQAPARKAEQAVGSDMDYLDIPAFLRRQAD